MASIKDLKKRIGSVKNTQQTTKAMKMVSAAKLRRAQDAITNNRPYAKQIGSLVETMRRYNENAAKGEDPDFHKGKKWLKPLTHPPYAVLDASIGAAVVAMTAVRFRGLREVLGDDARTSHVLPQRWHATPPRVLEPPRQVAGPARHGARPPRHSADPGAR